jgi:hypothetical protein
VGGPEERFGVREQRLTGMTRLDCRQSSGLIKARRSLAPSGPACNNVRSILACLRDELRYNSTMLHVQTIDSLDLPELAPYRTMRRQMEHREQGIFVAEGEKVVRRLLESNFTVVSVMLPEKWLRSWSR